MSPTEHTAWKGALGMLSPLLGYLVSRLAEIEAVLRILSLSGGLIVCALTIWSFIRNLKK